MGTNFYRIPTEEEVNARKERLIRRINDMIITPFTIECDFRVIVYDESPEGIPPVDCYESISPWDEFMEDMKVHLGKESSGWKFTWNFHKGRHYFNKETLFNFIRSGRVVDEYGTLIDNEEFIKEALEWGEPDGYIYNEEYVRTHPCQESIFGSEDYSKIIDGLVVSAHDEFC